MFIQRAEVGAGSRPQLGAASSAVLQVWPDGAPGGRAVQSLPGGQRCPGREALPSAGTSTGFQSWGDFEAAGKPSHLYTDGCWRQRPWPT